MVWLTRPGELDLQDLDVQWMAAARAASAEAGIGLTLVVVNPARLAGSAQRRTSRVEAAAGALNRSEWSQASGPLVNSERSTCSTCRSRRRSR